MRQETRKRLWRVLYDFAAEQLPKRDRWTLEDIRLAYPFHRLLFSEEAILGARVERSVVTSMGSGLYPSIARTIAEDRFERVFMEHTVEGVVNDAACNMIEQIVTELRTPKRRRATPREPCHADEVSDILNSPGGGRTNRAVTADLYIEDFLAGPLFVELKSPLPNLDIAAESKRKILYYLLIMDRKGVPDAQAYLGLTYNPFIKREAYAHSFTKQIMDMEHQVLMGNELWDMLGGLGTYTELLEIIEDVHGHLPRVEQKRMCL
ncbi:MAG: TdeIII family type II restriction endonuclease [Chloroflexi bacterium]|nr:TdeIII family type II restriction endonuclease [Chloroflexota bacterium]